MYEIYLERAAEKDLRKIPPPLFNTIIDKIKKLADNPHPNDSRKIINSENFGELE